MFRLLIIVVYCWVATGCAVVNETESEHFERDYLSAEEPNIHGIGISYEQLGTLRIADSVVIGVRNEVCDRRIEKGAFVGIDMRAYACNSECRAYRAVSVYDRTTVLPFHSIFRGITYDQLISSPFINAEVYLVRERDTLAIPLWQVDAIVVVNKFSHP